MKRCGCETPDLHDANPEACPNPRYALRDADDQAEVIAQLFDRSNRPCAEVEALLRSDREAVRKACIQAARDSRDFTCDAIIAAIERIDLT